MLLNTNLSYNILLRIFRYDIFRIWNFEFGYFEIFFYINIHFGILFYLFFKYILYFLYIIDNVYMELWYFYLLYNVSII